MLRRDHGWQRVRPIDTVGENGEILGLEICIGCKAKRRTALHSNGRVQVIATEPDPLPPYCSERFDDLGKLYQRKTALGEQPGHRQQHNAGETDLAR